MPNETPQERVQRLRQQMSGAPSDTQETPEQRVQRLRAQIQQPEPMPRSGGLLQGAANLVRDITKPAVTLAARPVQLAMALGGAKPEQQDINLPFFGDIPTPRGASDVVKDIGRGAQTVALGIGGPATKAATSMGRIGQFAGRGALGGGLFGAGAEVEKTGTVSDDTLTQGAFGAATGGVIGGALGKFARPAVQAGTQGTSALQRAAESQIGRVLAPTTKQTKRDTQKIAPEILERRIVATSDDELLRQARRGKEEALEALNATYASLPANARVDTRGIFLDITNAKNRLVTKSGIVTKGKQSQMETLDEIEKELSQIVRQGGEGIGNIREYRQQLDDVLAEAGKGFGLDSRDKAALKAQKILANSIRNEIGKQFPDVAKVNKDFTFWSRLIDVLQAKAERKTGQTGFTKTLGTITGGAVGSAGGGISGAVTGALVIRALIDFMQSTAWNTFSAVQKSRLSDLMSKGRMSDALDLLEKAGAPIRATSRFAPVAGVEALND